MTSPTNALAPRDENELGSLGLLAAQLTLGQLAPVLLSFFIFGLVAKLGSLTISAFAQVMLINLTAYTALGGVLTALYPLAGQRKGSGDQAGYDRVIGHGLLLALLLAIPMGTLGMLIGPLATLLQQPDGVPQLAQQIGWVTVSGVPASLLLAVLHIHLTLSGRAGAMSLVYLVGMAGSVLLALAAAGLGPADARHQVLLVSAALAIGNWLMLGASLLLVGRAAPLRLAWQGAWRGSVAVARTGWPIGCVIFLESAILMVSALVAGSRGVLAGELHMAALQWLNLCIVLPLSIGQACSQRIALLSGAGQHQARNRACWQALALAFGGGALVTLLLAAFPLQAGAMLLGQRAVHDAALVPILRWLMPAAGVLLLLESLVIVGAAALRGIGVVRATFALALLGSVLTIGALWAAGVWYGYGLPGLWGGMLGGFVLTAGAVLLRCLREFRALPAPL